MAFRIIADSSCDIFDLDRKIDGLYFNTVPFVITVDGRDFVDDDKQMYLRSLFHPISPEATTAHVLPGIWYLKTIRTEILRSSILAEQVRVFP